MSKNKSLLLHLVGFAWAGNDDLFEVSSFALNNVQDKLEVALKGGTYPVPIRQNHRALVTVNTVTLDLIARLTGGSVTPGSTRPKIETLTKASNALTLTQTPKSTDAIRVLPEGSSKSPLLQVSSAPSVGEYSISGTTITLNASQAEDDFTVTYLYEDGANGETLTIAPDDLPDTFSFFGVVKAEDVFPGQKGWFVAELAKVRRDSDITPISGGTDAQSFSFEVAVLNTSSGDIKIYHVDDI